MVSLSSNLTEEEVKLRYITPAIEKAGWGKNRIRMEPLIEGRILIDGGESYRSRNTSHLKPDYVLMTSGGKYLAVVEAKNMDHSISEGIQQSKNYASILDVPFAFSSNGVGFYEFDFNTGLTRELSMEDFPSEDELLARLESGCGIDKDSAVLYPMYFDPNTKKRPRYYQNVAVNRVVSAVEKGQKRILVVMATGTGKTFVSMQIIYKLRKTRKVNKVLFLVDRNNLADQTMVNDFKVFEKEMTKIADRKMDSTYPIQIALYQQLTDNDDESMPYKEYSPDFFDLIIVDECHRGSSNANSEWRKILEYFESATQIGMTATPREDADVSTSNYFGEAVYTYSYRQGVEDGFLAPFRLRKFTTTIDVNWDPNEDILDEDGQPVIGPYNAPDYDRRLIVDDRTRLVARTIIAHLEETGDRQALSKTIVFCEDTDHAARMRDAIAELSAEYLAVDHRYVMRITGNDPEGKKQLKNFNSKSSVYPVIVTTSELLSTGSDCFLTKVIAIDKNIGSSTMFKQILGRGSRLDEKLGKTFFTLLDFRNASVHLLEDGWDSTPEPYTGPMNEVQPKKDPDEPEKPGNHRVKQRIRGDVGVGMESELDMYYGLDGMTVENYRDYSRRIINSEYASLSDFINRWNETDRKDEIVRHLLLEGFDVDYTRKRMGWDNLSDFDVICHMAFSTRPVTKTERAENVMNSEFISKQSERAKAILKTLLKKYMDTDQNDLYNLDVLKLPEFDEYGGVIGVVRAFGGKERYLATVAEMQDLIYSPQIPLE
ncbi:MAG: DEAD/DEAH box helicase [Thermoplasmata archaeon]|nr:DEAD/DEAH box helicase [Thermoplasmata archaeon]